MNGAAADRRRDLAVAALGLAVIAAAAAILLAMGQPAIGPAGLKVWGGDEDSRHLLDWYTPSHFIHGFLFYFAFWLVARRRSIDARGIVALVVEAAWEVIENTPWVIGRYREVTVSVAYAGDTVVNSVSDIVAMLVGFWLASRLPVWLTVALAIAFEGAAAIAVRDNLTLNILMLLYPLDTIRIWQGGG